MAKSRSERIFKGEKYMDDVMSSIYSNINEIIKRREEMPMSVWGPFKSPANSSGIETEQVIMHGTDIPTSKLKIRQITDRKEINEVKDFTSSLSNGILTNVHTDIKEKHTEVIETMEQTPQKLLKNDKKRTVSESEYEKLENSSKNKANRAETKKDGKTFDDWCSKRYKEFAEIASSNCYMKQPTLNFPSPIHNISKESKIKPNVNEEMNTTKTLFLPEKERSEIKSNNLVIKIAKTDTNCENEGNSYEVGYLKKKIDTPNKSSLSKKKHSEIRCDNSPTIKDVKTNPCSEKKGNSYAIKYLTKNAGNKKHANSPKFKEKSLMCIKVVDEKDDRSYELMADLSDILRVRRKFPKLSEAIPDADSGSNEINYCVDAINAIFRYVFYRKYNFPDISSPKIGIEVLAATQSWDIDQLHQLLQRDFIQETLSRTDIRQVFSHASHFGLKEICDACKRISPTETHFNHLTYERIQKTCTVTISTYVEPLELCIPFYPVEKSLKLSFKRHISNKIRFKAVSNCYIITGIQIQLNEDHLKENSYENSMLEIDYSIKKASSEIENLREEKPIRPRNIIYFKKKLILHPDEVGEITVEADAMPPHLCSELTEQEMRITNSKFNLTMVSDFKMEGSSSRLFIIGKLFYHEN